MIIDNQELYSSALAALLQSSIPEISVVSSAVSAEEVMAMATETSAAVSLILINPEALSLNKSNALAVVRKLFGVCAIILLEDSDGSLNSPADSGEDVGLLGRADSSKNVVALVSNTLLRSKMNRDVVPDGSEISISGENLSEDRPGASAVAARRITRRQQQVIGMVSEGLANKEIAARLGIAEGTVKAHVHTVFRALGTTNRTQAALAYIGILASAPGQSGPELTI